MGRLLIAQVAIGFLAALVFTVGAKLGIDVRICGLVAGSGFIFIGVYGMKVARSVFQEAGAGASENRRMGLLALAMALIHLSGFAIPMVGYRLLHWGDPFSQIQFWGLSGNDFHKISTQFYSVWFIATAGIWLRLKWRARSDASKPAR